MQAIVSGHMNAMRVVFLVLRTMVHRRQTRHLKRTFFIGDNPC